MISTPHPSSSRLALLGAAMLCFAALVFTASRAYAEELILLEGGESKSQWNDLNKGFGVWTTTDEGYAGEAKSWQGSIYSLCESTKLPERWKLNVDLKWLSSYVEDKTYGVAGIVLCEGSSNDPDDGENTVHITINQFSRDWGAGVWIRFANKESISAGKEIKSKLVPVDNIGEPRDYQLTIERSEGDDSLVIRLEGGSTLIEYTTPPIPNLDKLTCFGLESYGSENVFKKIVLTAGD